VPPRRARPGPDQPSLLEARVTTAVCVPAIRKAVAEWQDRNYKGATDTTKLLLSHWFGTDHRTPDGGSFAYYPAQRDAIETLIYIFEIERLRRHRDLMERYVKVPGIHVLQYDDFARYAIKMATGSGKTKVISLAIAWQYLNAVAEELDDYARSFLLLAPNVIVFERLRADFAGGRIFHADPVIPQRCASSGTSTATCAATASNPRLRELSTSRTSSSYTTVLRQSTTSPK
jgi:type III restriction enzyme